MRFKVNILPKIQKVCTGPPVGKEEADDIRKLALSRRMMLSQVYSIYDPMGLLSPITIKYKMLLQKLVTASLDWDK